MRHLALLVLALFAVLFVDAGRRIVVTAPPSPSSIAARFAKLPTRFEANAGQTDPRVRFVARHRGASLFLTDEGATVVLSTPQRRSHDRTAPPPAPKAGPVVTLKVAHGRVVAPRAGTALATRTSYFRGNDRSQWRTNIPSYEAITYPGVLDGVDLVYHGEDGQLEYDFVVAPGADPGAITLDVDGADSLALSDTGDLTIHTANGDLVQAPPRVFQRDGRGVATDVAARYRLVGDTKVAFAVASYDRERPLVIDPTLAYATYLGGVGDDESLGSPIAIDGTGNVYLDGYTFSADFPATVGARQTTNAGSYDAFVAKLNADATSVVYATYLGGTALDEGGGIAVDGSGNAYVTGFTSSTDFPTTAGAFQTTNGGGTADAYVAKLNATGTALVYSTFLGGSSEEHALDVAIDGSGNAYVTGYTYSADFPVTAGAFQTSTGGTADGFVTKVNGTGTALTYSTYLGGFGNDVPAGIAVDGSGNTYVTGQTGSPNFPTTAGAFQTVNTGAIFTNDAFVAKLNAGGTALVYGTFIGGAENDFGTDIAIDASGNAYVVGGTSSVAFPTTAGAFQTSPTAGQDGFAAKLTATGAALVYSTYLGGSGDEAANGVALDATGTAFVVGYATGTFPITADAFQSTHTGTEAFVAKVKPTGAGLAYASYLGASGNDDALGIAVDGASTAYVAGYTFSTDFPVTLGVAQTTLHGSADSFVAKITTAPLTLGPPSASVFPRGTQAFTAAGGSGGYVYDLQTQASGAGAGIDGTGAYHAGNGVAGSSVVDVVRVTDSVGATATANVTVGPAITITASKTNPAPSEAVTISATGGSGSSYAWTISPDNSGATMGTTGTPVTYTAGTTASQTDTVNVTDSLGNTASINIVVGAGVTINPSAPSVAPQQGVTFTASGGSGPYTFASVTSNSGGSITAAGVYKAGTTPNVTDTIKVTDALLNVATTTITVGPALAVSPATTTSAPLGTVNFSVTGGTGIVTSWSVTTNNSVGATITAGGVYKAGTTGGVTDTVQATDSVGNTATATVTVTAGVSITPAAPSVPPRGTIDFDASGGSATGFTFALVTSGSGATLDATTGIYVAGATGSTTDKIEVTDSLGNKKQATVTVTAGVSITPASPAVAIGGTVALVATGGTNGPYTWAVTVNNSVTATVDGTGHYTAGTTGPVVDTVKATDALGNSATVNVSVGGAIAITPSSPSTPPRGAIAFTVTGGSGTGYAWSFVTNNSTGTINPSTGAYKAGPKPNVKDRIKVVDSLGTNATVDILVGAGVTITPAAATVAPLGAQTFGAVGGSGVGFAWSFSANVSGGTIGTGAYRAGPNGGVTDVIVVTDSLGNTASADVTVSPSLKLAPVNISVPTKGTVTFSTTGGAGPFNFAIVSNASGGNISSTGGAYTAGSKGSVVDVVRVTDANGATATATVNVGSVIAITPAAPAPAPKGKIAFSATGGSGAGYVWSILVDASTGATINAGTGAYAAGSKGHTTDVVQVRDSLGNTAGVSVSVGGGLAFTPLDPATPPKGVISFVGFGGGGAYAWSLTTNASGGVIDPMTGVYTAGPTGNVTDVLRLGDQIGNSLVIEVKVGAGVTVSPLTATVAAGATQAFAVAGGSGAGYAWTISTNASGAAIGPDGTYTAGSHGNVNDVVRVADSLGNTATATVKVTAVDVPPPPPPIGGGPDVPPPSSSSDDCGCRIVGGRTGAAPMALAALAILLGLARRRRRRM